MKKLILLSVLCLFALHISSQNTLLIYTKFLSDLNFIDESASAVPLKNLWQKDDGGYILNYEDADKTYISSENYANFKLSSQKKLTKLITLEENDKVSLHNCLNNEKYCCERLTDKQKKGTEKLFAVAVMKKSALKDQLLIFDEKNLKEFHHPENISINWKTKAPVKKVYLVDINEIKTIWEASEYTDHSFSYNTLENIAGDVIETGHKYQLNIVVEKDEEKDEKFTWDFELKPLAFENTEYYFPTAEAVQIKWNTDEKIKSISLEENKNNIKLWESNDFSSNTFSYTGIENVVENKLEPGKDYSLNIELENGKMFDYTFSVLLNEEESQELKKLIFSE